MKKRYKRVIIRWLESSNMLDALESEANKFVDNGYKNVHCISLEKTYSINAADAIFEMDEPICSDIKSIK